jgi:hypothetical protein
MCTRRLEFTIQTCTDDVCSQRVEAFGGTGGSPFACPIADGHALVGFAGGLGGHVHSFSIYTHEVSLPPAHPPLPFLPSSLLASPLPLPFLHPSRADLMNGFIAGGQGQRYGRRTKSGTVAGGSRMQERMPHGNVPGGGGERGRPERALDFVGFAEICGAVRRV